MKMLALAAPPERAGVYQAYMGGAVALGSIASFLALPHLALWDWRWPFVLPAALSCILLIMLCPVAAHHETNGRSKAPAQGLLSILALPQGWMLGLLHALSWGSVITLGNWGPSLLAQALGNSSTAQLAWVGAAVMLVSGVGRITGAPLLARFRPPLVAGMSMLLLAMVYLAISFAKGSSLTAVLIMAGAALASVNFGSIFQLACRAAGAEGLGGLLGFVNLLANVGAICFTLLLGWVRDQTDSFSPSFLMLAAACLSAGPAALLFYRRRS